MLGGKGDPYFVDLFLGFLKAWFGGLHRVRHCSQPRRRKEEVAAACENERNEGMVNLDRVFRAKN